jgi:hypothetical protein
MCRPTAHDRAAAATIAVVQRPATVKPSPARGSGPCQSGELWHSHEALLFRLLFLHGVMVFLFVHTLLPRKFCT